MLKLNDSEAATQRPWDAKLARSLVSPLCDTWISPNHLTTLRLVVGLAAAAAFLPGTYVYSNLAAVLLVLSNFMDHMDGELARMTGKSSRFGHIYDLASDALVTVLLFAAIGAGIEADPAVKLDYSTMGIVAGCAVALIFYLRMRIEDVAGKPATRQASLGGFETEDVLYLVPLVTLCGGLAPMLIMAAVGAPTYAVWTLVEYRRAMRRVRAPDSREVVQ